MSVDLLLPLPSPPAHLKILEAAEPDYIPIYCEGTFDAKVWKRWFRWKPIVAGGKPAVLEALRALRVAGASTYLGLVDADYDRIDQEICATPNLVHTASHDLECDLFRAGVCRALFECAEDCNSPTLTNWGPIEARLVSAARSFGLVRWLFFRRGVAFPDKRISPWRFTRRDLALVEDELLEEAARSLATAKSAIVEEFEALAARNVDPWQICHGHDLVGLVSVCLKKHLDASQMFPDVESLRASMLVAITIEHVERLAIWHEIASWETANKVTIRNRQQGHFPDAP